MKKVILLLAVCLLLVSAVSCGSDGINVIDTSKYDSIICTSHPAMNPNITEMTGTLADFIDALNRLEESEITRYDLSTDIDTFGELPGGSYLYIQIDRENILDMINVYYYGLGRMVVRILRHDCTSDTQTAVHLFEFTDGEIAGLFGELLNEFENEY